MLEGTTGFRKFTHNSNTLQVLHRQWVSKLRGVIPIVESIDLAHRVPTTPGSRSLISNAIFFVYRPLAA